MAKATLVNRNLSALEVGALITEGKWIIRGAKAKVEMVKKTRGKPITKTYHVALPMLSVDLEVDEEVVEAPKKKSGRKPKVTAATEESTAPKKKPGRKPKVDAKADDAPKLKANGEPRKKPGRKPKAKVEEPVVTTDEPVAVSEEPVAVSEEPVAPKKKPGRKPRIAVDEAEEAPKPRKRKKRVATEAPAEEVVEPVKQKKEPAAKEQSSSNPWNLDPDENEYEF